MPFYEYECQNCKYYTEVMQKISDPPLRKCPSCSKMQLKKLVSAPVFRLKGGGWYETDFKSDKESKRNLAGSEAEAAASSDSKTEAAKSGDAKAGESKPADAKPEAKSAEKKTPAAESGGSSGKRSSSAAKSPSRAAAPRPKPRSTSKATSKSPARKARR